MPWIVIVCLLRDKWKFRSGNVWNNSKIKNVCLHFIWFDSRCKCEAKTRRDVRFTFSCRTESNETSDSQEDSALTVINNHNSSSRKKLFSPFNTHSADRLKIACHTTFCLHSLCCFHFFPSSSIFYFYSLTPLRCIVLALIPWGNSQSG